MTRYATAARVLVVDDEPGNIALVSRLMTGLGYEVATATNGEAALEAVRRVPPDVILLDVNMPLLDGFEVCRRLKHDVATRLIPVVLLTGLTKGKIACGASTPARMTFSPSHVSSPS